MHQSTPSLSLEFLTLPSGRVLEIESLGEGRPVALLPGLGCTSALFARLLPYLPFGFRYILINPRGMGASDVAFEDYEVEDLAIDTLLAMNQMGHPCFDVLGVSFGGFVAQALVGLTPWRVRSLALISTSAGGPNFRPLPVLRDGDLESFYDLDPRVRAGLSVAATVYPQLKEHSPETYERIVELRTHPRMNAEQVIYQNHAAKRFLAREADLGTIHCPTLVMSGASDRFVPVENARALASGIDGAKLILINKADHLAILERPEVCAKELSDFWESL